MVLTNRTCPAENTASIDQDTFFSGHWDAHKLGWIISGATAAIATLITLISVWKHARRYYFPQRQRQVIRILFMPAVYAVVSFFSYRFFRAYTYYELALTIYESLVLAAFLMLMLNCIGDSTEEQKQILRNKDKSRIPFPLCFIRYRPSKPYFLHALKWTVLQYSLIRPLISIAGIVTQALNVYCSTQYSVYYAAVYLAAADFVSISIALYGLITFYALCKEQLAGQKPLAKFLNIKGIVFLVFYQSFIFDVLQSHGVIKATQYWTATNVADGLNALTTCCEMVIFSLTFMYAFSWKEYSAYRTKEQGPTNPFKALLDSFNYSDFFIEGWHGLVFLVRFILRRPGTRSSGPGALDFDEAFHGVVDDEPETTNHGKDVEKFKTDQQGDHAMNGHGANKTFLPSDAFGSPQVRTTNRMREPTPSSAYSGVDSYYFRKDSLAPAVPDVDTMPTRPAAGEPRHDWQSETVVWSGDESRYAAADRGDYRSHERAVQGYQDVDNYPRETLVASPSGGSYYEPPMHDFERPAVDRASSSYQSDRFHAR